MKFHYSVDKMVTEYNETSQDWSGESRDFGIIETGTFSADTVATAIDHIADSVLGLHGFTAVDGEIGRYETNTVENGDGLDDENGKYLADYNIYIEQLVPVSEVA